MNLDLNQAILHGEKGSLGPAYFYRGIKTYKGYVLQDVEKERNSDVNILLVSITENQNIFYSMLMEFITPNISRYKVYFIALQQCHQVTFSLLKFRGFLGKILTHF